MTDSPPRLSLSDMAVQMENLIHTLIPFKTTQLDQFRQNKELDLKQTTEWWDGMIASLECELGVLRDHAAALGIEIKEPTIADGWPGSETKTATEIRFDSPAINDDPAAAEREIRLIAERNS